MKAVIFFLLLTVLSAFSQTCQFKIVSNSGTTASRRIGKALDELHNNLACEVFTILLDHSSVYGKTGFLPPFSSLTIDKGNRAMPLNGAPLPVLRLATSSSSSSWVWLNIKGYPRVTLEGLKFESILGPVQISAGGEVALKKVSFKDALGGLEVSGGAKTIVTGSTFQGIARIGDENGGCLQTDGPIEFDATTDGNTMTGCLTPKVGGAAFTTSTILIKGGDTDLRRNIFKDNGADNGCHVYANGAVTVQGRNRFTGGTTSRSGSIYSKSSVVVSGASTFEENRARNGGSIYSEGPVTIEAGQSFKSGFVLESGGVVYSKGAIEVNGLQIFESNTATSNGGALYSESTITVNSGTTFKSNIALNNGGAIWSKGNIVVSSSQFNGNKARKGGALFTESGTFTATNCGFADNTASTEGHVVSWTSTSSSTFSGSTFSNNYAVTGGRSVVVPTGGELILQKSGDKREITPEAWIETNIWLSAGSSVARDGIKVDIQCVDQAFVTQIDTFDGLTKTYPNIIPTEEGGIVTCKPINLQQVSTLGFSIPSPLPTGKNRFDLRDAILAQTESEFVHVFWKLVAGNPAKYSVFVVFFDSDVTEQYHDLYDLQATVAPTGTAKRAPNGVNDFNPNFTGSTTTFATQDENKPECAKDDPNACSKNGYCVDYAQVAGSTGNYVGFCSCMSGWILAQCKTNSASSLTLDPVGSTEVHFEPFLAIAIGSDVDFTVTIPLSHDAHDSVPSYATTTFIRFTPPTGSTEFASCDYPQKQDSVGWVHGVDAASKNDTYTATFTYNELKACGLKYDTASDSNPDFAVWSNYVTIERHYTISNGRFTIERVGKVEHLFEFKFPKKVRTFADIKVKNNTVEFYATVSEISYSHVNHQWKAIVSTAVANDFKLQSLYVAETSPFGEAPVNEAPDTRRKFDLTRATDTVNCPGGICTQEFEFTWDECTASHIVNFPLSWKVVCSDQPGVDCVKREKDEITLDGGLTLSTESACPRDEKYTDFDESISFYGTEADLEDNTAIEQLLFGSSEWIFIGFDFTVPASIDNIQITAVCAYPDSEKPAEGSPVPPCKGERSIDLTKAEEFVRLSAPAGDHQIGFKVQAGILKAASKQNGNKINVQVDLKLDYGETFSKRTTTFEDRPHSAVSQIGISNRQIENIAHNLPEGDANHSASSSSFLSVSVALLAGTVFLMF